MAHNAKSQSLKRMQAVQSHRQQQVGVQQRETNVIEAMQDWTVAYNDSVVVNWDNGFSVTGLYYLSEYQQTSYGKATNTDSSLWIPNDCRADYQHLGVHM